MKKISFLLLIILNMTSYAQQIIIMPPFLEKGDTIALLSPASTPDVEFVLAAEKVLKEWGYITVRGENILNKTNGTYAGTKEQRYSDLMNALLDPSIKAIMCTRGGYGSIHEIQDIPLAVIRDNPKWIIGYSDITVLQSAWVTSGVMGIHAHMCEHLMDYEGKDDCSSYLKGILEGKLPHYTVPVHPLNHLGDVTGTLIGGNLSVMCGFTGTYLDFCMRNDNLILFLEDVGEDFNHVDRYINLLKLHGVLDKVKGIIIGQFTHYKNDGDYPDMNYLFDHYLKDKNIPVIYNFPVGHVKDNYPLIEGAKVHMSVTTEKCELDFLPY